MENTSSNSSAELPLSAAQQAIWADLNSNPAKEQLYNLHDYVDLEGAVDAVVFEKAIAYVVTRRASLRTRFVAVEGQVRLLIQDRVHVDLLRHDVSDASNPHASASDWMQEQCNRCLGVQDKTLFRFALIRLDTQRFYWYSQYHHLISDGVGNKNLKDAIAAAYTAFNAGREPELADDTAEYLAYLQQNEVYQKSPQYQLDAKYWRSVQATRATLAMRRYSRDRMANALHTEMLRLDATLTANLKRVATELNISLPRLFVVSFLLYLQRVAQTASIAFELPTHGRVERWMDPLIATCSNLLPIRIEIDATLDLHQCMKDAEAQVAVALAHRRTRFEEIRHLQRLKPSDLNDCRVRVNAVPFATSMRFGDCVGTSRFVTARYAEDFIAGILMGSGGNQSIRFFGNPSSYQLWELEAHLANYHEILKLLTSHAQMSLAALPLTTKAEAERLAGSDAPSKVCSAPEYIHRAVERCAQSTPHAVALIVDGKTFTYSELNNQASRFAQLLVQSGVRPGVHVGIFADHSLLSHASVLATLKIGAIFVPLDPHESMETWSEIATIVNLFCIATTDEMQRERAQSVASIIMLEGDATPTHLSPSFGESPAAPCCVAFRRETRTTLVGVTLSHAATFERSVAIAQTFSLDSTDRVAQFSSSFADTWLHEVFPAWCVGAAVVGIPNGTLLERFGRLASSSISAITLSNAHWCAWVEHLEQNPTDLPTSLRLVSIVGSTIPSSAYNRWQRLAAGKTIGLLYSFSCLETGACIFYRTSRQDSVDDISTGRPLAGTDARILDCNMQPVPVGISGELCISGSLLSSSYIKNSDMTQLRFVAQDSGKSERRLFKTGTIARYRGNGDIELLGNHSARKEIVGQTIDFDRIEWTLNQHRQISQAVAIVQYQMQRPLLVIYFVSAGGVNIGDDELRMCISDQLPDYKIPTRFIQRDEMPIARDGQADRRALSLLPLPPSQIVQYIAPRTSLEELLTRICSEAMQVEQIGIYDNLFDLGLDSIAATFIVACIQDELRRPLSLNLLFEACSIADLANKLAGAESAPADAQSLPA